MHVLILPSSNYQTPREPLGGIFQYHQAHALERNGFQVGVLSSGFIPLRFSFADYPYLEYEADREIRIYRKFKRQILPERVARWLKLRVNLKKQLQMRLELFQRYVAENGLPDVVHAHDCLYAGYLAREIKEKWKIPYVVTEHSGGHAIDYIPPWQRMIIREALMHADARTAVSSWLARLLTELYEPEATRPIGSIGNLLDRGFEDADGIVGTAKGARTDGQFTFLNIASFDENKAHSYLFSAFARSFRNRKAVRLKVAGEGPLKSRITRHAIELGIDDQVIFLGTINRAEVLAEMQSCNAFVLNSHIETFGVVLIEALACGKPAVVTACGGPDDFIGGQNGILVPTRNVEALAESLERMLLTAHTYDPAAIRADCIERFGESAFVARLGKVYQQATQSYRQ